MRRPTIFSPSAAVAMFMATFCVPLATAQESETDLLQVLVCEIRELRSVIQRGQVLVPLLEANRRERQDISQQLAKVEGELRLARQGVQGAVAMQGQINDGLRELTRSGRQELDRAQFEARTESLEGDLKSAGRVAVHYQAEEARLFSEAGQIRERLSRLEDEFDRMQRQMQVMATAASTVCESDSRR